MLSADKITPIFVVGTHICDHYLQKHRRKNRGTW